MLILFLVCVLSAMGFGLVLPSLLFYAENLGATPDVATLIIAAYAVGQFISTPIWGRLSDRFGRKPILIISSAGMLLSYLLLAWSWNLWVLGLARGFGGLMADTFSAAAAYVTDITLPEQRAKGMGMVGAGMSVGFILGPALGGLLGGADAESASLFGPGLAAAGIAAFTVIAIALFLRESLPPEQREQLAEARHPSQLDALRRVLAQPLLAIMVFVGLFYSSAFALNETIFPLWSKA